MFLKWEFLLPRGSRSFMGIVMGEFNRVLKTMQKQMIWPFYEWKSEVVWGMHTHGKMEVRNTCKSFLVFSNIHPEVPSLLLKPLWSKFLVVLFLGLPATTVTSIKTISVHMYNSHLNFSARSVCLYLCFFLKHTSMLPSHRDFVLNHKLDCFYLEYLLFYLKN